MLREKRSLEAAASTAASRRRRSLPPLGEHEPYHHIAVPPGKEDSAAVEASLDGSSHQDPMLRTEQLHIKPQLFAAQEFSPQKPDDRHLLVGEEVVPVRPSGSVSTISAKGKPESNSAVCGVLDPNNNDAFVKVFL